jgi:hypothetical protein
VGILGYRRYDYGNGTNSITIDFAAGAASGILSVTADNACGSSAAQTLGVTITAVPTAAISYAGTPFCSSVSTAQSVTLTGSGAYTGGTFSAPAGLTINGATGP